MNIRRCEAYLYGNVLYGNLLNACEWIITVGDRDAVPIAIQTSCGTQKIFRLRNLVNSDEPS